MRGGDFCSCRRRDGFFTLTSALTSCRRACINANRDWAESGGGGRRGVRVVVRLEGKGVGYMMMTREMRCDAMRLA